MSARSVNRYSATICKILDCAAGLDVIIKKPNVIFMEEEKGRKNTYTDPQISQFMQWARGRGDERFADMIIKEDNSFLVRKHKEIELYPQINMD